MNRVGLRELKAKLSSYIKKVLEKQRVVVTEHGEEVALIIPVSEERRAMSGLVKSGKAHWDGGKPRGFSGITMRGIPLSDTILVERQ